MSGVRPTLVGRVVSVKMQKTINVAVERYRRHPILQKVYRKTRKFLAHDPNEEAKFGDTVKIQLSRPHSKRKKFELLQVVRRAPTEAESPASASDSTAASSSPQ
eukprot:TRINITY_DN67822_c8_g5_i1.p1 TRINITY_DN67822_c8_g5~~TRINITY_DN67822_c8_g5_i1.p1  ORF type:complete len:114 (+),score=28.16 TRINITY_DN67822_c8_g5_i1:32-343(+)